MNTDQKVRLVFEARKMGLIWPKGSSDRHRRWYPSKLENCDGFTKGRRKPSGAWPYSYRDGARTLKHIRAVAELEPAFFEELVAEALAADVVAKIAEQNFIKNLSTL
jgi:hypothetical protein